MNLGMMRRRYSGDNQPDIYEGCVTLEFIETTDNNERVITANHNNVITYLEKLIIDGEEYTPTKNYKHTFSLGKHKVGWKFKSSIIYANVMAATSSPASSANDKSLVTIPSHITQIVNYAMRGVPAYAPKTGVTCYATTPPTASTNSIGLWYMSSSKGNYVRVPAESVDAYKAAKGWSDYASRIIAI